jgi:hypothetical protein
MKSATGAGDEELMVQSGANKSVLAWSPNGSILTYSTDSAIWGVTAGVERKPSILIGESKADQADISPDGKWMAYRSFDSGISEIYVQPFPHGSGKWQISTSGGSEPYWRREGKELFYMNGNAMMAVAIKASTAGFEPSAPVKLFEAPATGNIGRNRFVATPDGQRFLIVTARNQVSLDPIQMVLNWQSLLKH